MAPEMFVPRGEQTHKADVWSLYVTIIWSLNAGKLRDVSEPHGQANQLTLADLESLRVTIPSLHLQLDSPLSEFSEMGRFDLHERASAAQILVKVYDGEGLSTQLRDVPPILYPPTASTQSPTTATSPPHTTLGIGGAVHFESSDTSMTGV